MRKLAIVLLVVASMNAWADAPEKKGTFNLAEIQGMLAVKRLDGWLLYDFHGQNPIAREVVHPDGITTRRWFYFIPQKGEPVALIHKIETQGFAAVPGKKIEYAGRRELAAGLKTILKGKKRIAMEYSPGGAIPYLSRVDAGTLEMVKAYKVKVVSSAELVQTAKSRWGEEGRASHYIAVHHLTALKDEAFAAIADRVRRGEKVTEYDISQLVWNGYKKRGLESDGPPIVAVGPNTANPHYEPPEVGSVEIKEGDLVLLDLWAREPGGIYADMTWIAYVGKDVPKKYADLFAVVAKARDETVKAIDKAQAASRPKKGFEADQVARAVLEKAGHKDHILHRTGHSIDTSVHGDGANLDDFETKDVRTLIRDSGFSVEPGVYLPGEYGMRSEIDCYLARDKLEVTTPLQTEIVPLLK